MTTTAGQKLGSLLVPLYLLAVLGGGLSGAAVGLVASLIALVQFTVAPELWANWGPAGAAFIPVLFGIPIGGVLALAPATGSIVGLFIQAWNVPFPTIKEQSLVAGIGAGVAAGILAALPLLDESSIPLVIIPLGAAFALVSAVLAWWTTARCLRYRESKAH